MKHLTKTALCGALAAASALAVANPVEIVLDNGSVIYSPDVSGSSVQIADGTITLTGYTYTSGTLPGSDGSVSCGDNTTLVNGVCEAEGSASCGPGTVDNGSGMCIVDDPAPFVTDIRVSASTVDHDDNPVIYFDFSEPVTGFTAADIDTNASSYLGNVTGSGTSYQVTFNAPQLQADQSFYFGVLGGGYTDGSGQAGEASTNGQQETINVNEYEAPTIGNCEVPENVNVINNDIFNNWGTSTSLMEYNLPRNKTISGPIRLGTNEGWFHRMTVWGNYKTANMVRKIWVSECPGGAPVVACAASVGSSITFYSSQNPRASRTYCKMGTDQNLYLNIQHLEDQCTSTSCGIYMQYTASGTLD